MSLCSSLVAAMVLGAAPAAATPALRGEAPAAAVQTGFLFRTIHVAHREYRYAVFVPRDYDSSRAWPAIVFLHGAGECGTDGAKPIIQGIGSAILSNVQKWPFIVLFPQKPDVHDRWEQHDAAVMAMLARAEKEYRIDTDRVYLTGVSQGGHGTWAIGGMHPDVWAAIAPICGYGNPSRLAKPLRHMPIWAFHGEADDLVSPGESKDLVAAVNAAGGTAKLTLYPGVNHNSWDKAYREEKLYDWFLAHHREHTGVTFGAGSR